LPSYRFASPLLGLVKSSRGYQGWYEPTGEPRTWTIHLTLPAEETRGLERAEVNGTQVSASRRPDGAIELKGQGGRGKPLRWSLHPVKTFHH
jgi:hypothetical protein